MMRMVNVRTASQKNVIGHCSVRDKANNSTANIIAVKS